MNRPCVVLAKRARQVALAELSPRLVDTCEQELALALRYRRVAAGGWCSDRRSDGDRAKEDIEEPHIVLDQKKLRALDSRARPSQSLSTLMGNMVLYIRQGPAVDDAAEAITPWWRDANCVEVRSSSGDCPRMVASRNLASRKLDVPAMLVMVKHRESRR